jgi:hypothetical protein
VNARILLILSIPLLISGCSALSWFKSTPEVKQIEIKKTEVERTRLNLQDPKPLNNHEIKWIVITPENAEKIWNDLRESNTDLVLFGLTDDGYEQLAISIAEIRNFIAQQRTIIIKYREYYEPAKEEVKPADSKR